MPWIETEAIGNPVEIFPTWFLDRWQKLVRATYQADPFCCAPAWNLAYHQAVNYGRKLFYAASGHGLIIFGKFISPDGQPILAPLEDSWLYGQPLLGEDAPELLDHCLPEIEAEFGRMPLIFVSGLIDRSQFAVSLYLQFARRFDFFRHCFMSQCSASLIGGLDGWLGRRSANCRAKLKKADRLAKAAGISYERINPSPEEAGPVYERMLKVEEQSWKGIENCGMTESPSREFYREMIAILAQTRSAPVIFAKIEEKDVGFIFGGLLGSCYRGQQFSYSNKYKHLSLGNLLQREKISWLSEMGCIRYDMGPVVGPRMEYKRHWTEQSQDFQTWVMRKSD